MKKFRVRFEAVETVYAEDEDAAVEAFFALLMDKIHHAEYTVLDLDIEEVRE